jgi:hypothetical protein
MPPSKGCTFSIALNYFSSALYDDSSCIIIGCTDSRTDTFDPLANHDDGKCTQLHEGCTDSTASNYRSIANVEVRISSSFSCAGSAS